MKWLITGGRGQLGRCLADELASRSINDVVQLSRSDLDICNQMAINAALARHRPDVLVNAAAYTAVDAAEHDEESAFSANAVGPGFLARAAAARGIRFVHVSTDYVFDGAGSSPYPEDAPPDPQCAYGRTKLAGETAVLAANADALIVRTAWVFSEYGKNFLKTMLRIADRPELRVVDDQRGSPTDARHLGQAIIAGIEHGLTGLAHYSDRPEVSWADFSEAIFQRAYTLGRVDRIPNIIRIRSDEFPSPVKRPAYSVLANNRIPFQANWRESLDRVISSA